jgi:hypothetical protein
MTTHPAGPARDKRDETAHRVQGQVTHAREVVVQRAPALSRTVRQRPGLAAAVAIAMVFLLVGRLLQRSHREDRVHREGREDRKDRDGTR